VFSESETMGIFPKIEIRTRDRKTGTLTDDAFFSSFSPMTKAGISINETTALKYLTLFVCVSLVSGDIARLPLLLFQRFSDGSKQRIADHPLYDLLHTAPNPETNSYLWREMGEGQLLLWGNTIAEIEREKYTEDIKYLWPIEKIETMQATRNRDKTLLFSYRTICEGCFCVSIIHGG
jgi:phage portal protein BeeE